MAKPRTSATPPVVAGSPERFRDEKQLLLTRFLGSGANARTAGHLIKDLTDLVDATLAALWQRAGLPTQAALVGVGGYGRGELLPYSDIDVLVLLPDGAEPDAGSALKAALEQFISSCWDTGLEIGSSVRSVADCVDEARRDVTVQTAMLESRCLAGDPALFAEFVATTIKVLEPSAFFRAKTLEMRQRHIKYEDTPYALEPNCKESPGGLRDLQVVMWVARAASLGRSWTEMAANGLITPFEAKQVRRQQGILTLIRARLHAVAGRREDRLVFDLQTAVADSYGYRSSRSERSSEVLMHHYYWVAKAVTQLNQILMLNIEERVNGSGQAPMRRINARFFDRAGMLEVARDDLYTNNPHAILETFLVYQQTTGIKGLSARTLRALYNARDLMDSGFRHDPQNREMFMDILRQPQGLTHALRLMNATSVLGRTLWVFRRIVGRMQHDLFHVYTVDQHILMVVRNVRRFFIPEHGHEYPFCSQLAAEWDKPWLLYVAALFHDVAKGRGGDHSTLGATEVRRFCRDHGIEGEDAALAEFLVRHHLTMSTVAQKEDLSDPEVVRKFVAIVGDVRHLTALYLLTVADIRGTSPKVWNAWKGRLLEDLFRVSLRALGGAKPNLSADLEARKQEARHLLALHSALPGTENALWLTLEPSYFARHDAGSIAWHARVLWRHIDSAAPVVRARPSPIGDGLQVVVYSPDHNDLFVRICGYFDRIGFSIQDAKVHTSHKQFALDTFQVVYPNHDAGDQSNYRDMISLIEHQLALALVSTDPLPEPRRGRISRRVRSFPVTPRVSLRPDERAQRWLLTVSTSDRAGLLYALARVLSQHQVNLQLAKITTLGERVEDTFLLDGPALQKTKVQLQIESELLDAAAPMPPG